ncbi:MAG: hypothetical protein RL313_270 [Actinomycetota bacterium]
MSENILELHDLSKHFEINNKGIRREKGVVKAVDGVTFSVGKGETVGLVGESGCGKTTVGRTVMKLYEPTAGKMIFEGQDITNFSRKEMKPLRSRMQMIFQDPYSSLNPRHTVGSIIEASFDIHGIKPAGGVEAEIKLLLERVGLNPEHINRFPHEFSGGQRQRIGIARALALRPQLIVADEPVSALDVSIQAQVVNLLDDLFRKSWVFPTFLLHTIYLWCSTSLTVLLLCILERLWRLHPLQPSLITLVIHTRKRCYRQCLFQIQRLSAHVSASFYREIYQAQ